MTRKAKESFIGKAFGTALSFVRTDGPAATPELMELVAWEAAFQEPTGKQFYRMYKLEKNLTKGSITNTWTATANTDRAPSHGSVSTFFVKQVKKKNFGINEALLEEVRILRIVQHSNIIRIYQCFYDDRDYDYVVLEPMTGGELFDHIAAKDGYNEQQARAICRSLLSAVNHCHAHNVIHRDLKPGNMVLSSDKVTIKLAGFARACSVEHGNRNEPCGTPHYMAPEILRSEPYGKPVDMWSIGVIFYTILSGSLPFKAMRQTTLFRKIQKGNYKFQPHLWDNISNNARDLISKLLVVDASRRITASDALKHQWFGAADQSLANHDLKDNLTELQIFNAKRKFRAAIHTVLAMKALMSSLPQCERDYVLGKKLGQGAFATVFSATKTGAPAGSGHVAIKRTHRKDLDPIADADLRDEVRILKSLNHPHVVGFVNFYEDDPEYYYMVLEFMAGGELFGRIVEKSKYNEEEARNVCRVMLVSIKYIHDEGIVHRDLKPENLLLAEPKVDTSVKLADFGFATSVRDGPVTTQCGTPGYVAPEILKGKPYKTSVDMWSIGVIIYILLGGYPPFIDENQTRMFRRIKAGVFKFHDDYWNHVSNDAKDLIKKLLTVDENKRWTATQALDHPWLLASGDTLKQHDLGLNLDKLRIFNAKRKLRTAVKTVVMLKNLAEQLGKLWDVGDA